MSEKEAAALEALDKLNIPYVRLEHPPCASMEECAAIVSPSGAKHCKNLFLTNKRGTEFYLLLLHSEKRFVTSEVSRLLGSTRLSFASDQKLEELLGLSPGSISVTGLINDTERRVHPVIDADILKDEKMLIHPSVNTASLEVDTKAVKALVEGLGYRVRVIYGDEE
ncbi:MAG: prolyl-tRNA synthetase associated domain-containing protein [Clostridia bacterium]|nr:prolyl-tRNA synthetase associated domain-containing protein [Clostridia bacterium]